MDEPVAVAGDESLADDLRAAGRSVTDDLLAATAVVAVGESGLQTARRADGDHGAILPVDVRGVPSIDRNRVPAALSALDVDAVKRLSLPVLAVECEGEPVGDALFDVTLMTQTPAHISAFAVRADGVERRFRADGVVVATSAGSAGYARDVADVRLTPTASSLAIVPVAAFATRAERLIAPLDAIAVEVVRDRPAILSVDETAHGAVTTGDGVSIRPDEHLPVIDVRTLAVSTD